MDTTFKCESCANIVPFGCTKRLCADHCTGCDIHKSKGSPRPPPVSARPRRTIRFEQTLDEDAAIQKAIQLSLSNLENENNLLEQILSASIKEEEENTKIKVSNVKMILPHVPEDRIIQTLKECRGDQDAALDLLLAIPPEEFESKSPSPSSTTNQETQIIFVEQEDECVICLESLDCYSTSCRCCKMCQTCLVQLMKKKCPICKTKTKLEMKNRLKVTKS